MDASILDRINEAEKTGGALLLVVVNGETFVSIIPADIETDIDDISSTFLCALSSFLAETGCLLNRWGYTFASSGVKG